MALSGTDPVWGISGGGEARLALIATGLLILFAEVCLEKRGKMCKNQEDTIREGSEA
jgi:hypothetical protein